MAIQPVEVLLFSAVAVIVSHGLMTKKYKYALLSIIGGTLLFYLSPTVQELYWAKTGKEFTFLQNYSGGDLDPGLGSGRIGRWLATIDDFKEAGLSEKIFGTGSTIGPHGQYFDLLKRVGIFGLIVTVAFFLKILKDLYKIVRNDQTNVLALQSFLFCIAILVLGLTANPLSQYYLLIAFFGLLAMLEKQQKLKPIGLSTL